MGKFNKLQSGFQLGEIGPRSLALTDLESYFKGCTQLKNFMPMKNGGAQKRGGTQHVVSLDTLETDPLVYVTVNQAGLIPFVVSKNEAYVIAIKFNGTTSSWCAAIDQNGAAVNIDTSRYMLASLLPIPAANLDVNGFDYVQIANTLFIVHNSGSFYPIQINRVKALDGTYGFVAEEFGTNHENLYAYMVPNISSSTLTPSATTGSITLTSSAGMFSPEHVGASFKLTHTAVTGRVTITAVTSTTAATASVWTGDTLGGTGATTNWEEGSWSEFRGFPRTITSFEQRVIFGGNEYQPDTMWGSRTGNPFHLMAKKFAQDQGSATDVSGNNYFGDDEPTDPWIFTLSSGEVNDIVWMDSNRVLNVGTLGEEYVGSGGNEILSAQSVNFTPQTNYGSKNLRSAKVNNEVIYVSRSGRVVRNFQYSDSNGSNTSVDLTSLSDHLSSYGGDAFGFEFLHFHKSRNIVWALTRNRQLVGFTYSRENGVLAWHKHEFGGDDVKIYGVCSIPNAAGDWDDLYLSVERTIDGGSITYLEKVTADFDFTSLTSTIVGDSYRPIFLDSSIFGTAVAVTATIGGLDHLEDETVTVLINGSKESVTYLVTAGAITLAADMAIGDQYIVGLLYEAILDTVDLEGGGDFGTSQGLTQRIDRAVIKFYNTMDAKVGSPNFSDRLETILFTELVGYTERRINLSTGPERDQRVRVLSEEPLPCTILGIISRGVTND